MKAKFFSPRFIFSVLAVFVVICMFVVYFGVVRASGLQVSSVIPVVTNEVPDMQKTVGSMDTIAHAKSVIGSDKMESSVLNSVYGKITVLDLPDRLATLDRILVDAIVVSPLNVVHDDDALV